MQLKLGQNLMRAMEVEKHESIPVFLLLAQSIFLGIFNGAFDIAGNSMFLEKYPSEMLPKAFIVSGIAGILMTALYTFFQSKIGFKTLAVFNLLVISLSTVLLWIGMKMNVGDWIYFAILVMMGPLIILSVLGFWGTAGRIFSLRQGKRLFGLIDSGMIVGFIISSYAIPILLSFGVSTINMLLICTISVAVALLFQLYIAFRKNIFTADTKPPVKTVKSASLLALMSNRFVRLMAFFVGLSMICAFFIYFSFLAVTKIRYPNASEFAQFFGFFTGTVMVFTLIVKTTVYGKFMKTYGLKTGLVISPVILFIFTVLAAVIGSFGGFSVSAAGFIFFFLIIVLSRLLSRTLKDSIESPAFKILYQSIDKSSRYNIQSQIDGTVNEFSALFSGVILAIVGLLSFVTILHYSYVLIGLTALWTYVAFALYKEYKKNLSDSLLSIINTTENEGEISESIGQQLNMYKLLKPIHYKQIVSNETNTGKSQITTWIEKLKYTDTIDVSSKKENNDSLELLSQLMHSHLVSKREEAAKLIARKYDEQYIPSLKSLLRDNHQSVRKIAIKAAVNYKNREIYSLLVDNLLVSTYARDAYESLFYLGEPVIDALEQGFHKTGNGLRQYVRIIRLMGSIGGEKTMKFVFSKINHTQQEVSSEAAKQLLLNKYIAKGDEYYNIQQVLTRAVGVAAWNISTRLNIQNECSDKMLSAMNEEVEESTNYVFLLLSLMYDSNSIKHIRNTLESGQGESAGFALELLDQLIADDIKPILSPLFDDISAFEKVKQLQDFFPLDKKDYYSSLIDIVNRDFNHLSLWTKACALDELCNIDNLVIDETILALLFHPEELIYQTAAEYIIRNDLSKWKLVEERLQEETKRKIENNQNSKLSSLHLVIADFKKNNSFAKISGKLLFTFVKQMHMEEWAASSTIELEKHPDLYGIWISSGEIVLVSGTTNLTIDDSKFVLLKENKIQKINIKAASVIFKIDLNEYENILFDNPELANYLVFDEKTIELL